MYRYIEVIHTLHFQCNYIYTNLLKQLIAIITLTSALCFGIPAAYPCTSRDNLIKFNSTAISTCDKQLDLAHLQVMFCNEVCLTFLFFFLLSLVLYLLFFYSFVLDFFLSQSQATEYNELASLLWTPPNVALPLLYHRDIGTFSLLTLGIFPVIYFFLAVLSSG